MSDSVDPIGDEENGTAGGAPGAPIPHPKTVLGRVPTGTSLRRELAAAARSRGRTSSVSDELVELCDAIATINVEPADLNAARRRVADASGEEERLKERVATLRGDVQARRAVEAEAGERIDDLESAAAELSSVQTERIAAEQALERERDRAARARDERDRRLELRDRLRNRRRDARRELANEIYPAFRSALTAVPGGEPADAGGDPSEYEGPALAGSLAAIRIADLDGPVVLGEDVASQFEGRDGPKLQSVVGVETVRHPRP